MFHSCEGCIYKNNKIYDLKQKNVVLLIADSHVEQWYGVILPFLFENKYFPIQLYENDIRVFVKDLSI